MTTVGKLVSIAGAVILLGQGMAFGQAQSKNQQGCVNALNKDGAKVGATQGKENTSCIKNAGKGKESNAQGCLTADSKGKVAKAASKISADFDKKCTAETPTTGVPGVFSGTAAAVADAGQDDEIQFVADVFGSDLNLAILTDKAGSKCQATVSKDSEKIFATYMKGFLKCKKGALKAGSSLDACVLDDGGKVGKTVSKLSADIGKKCADTPVATFAPGLCSGSSTGDLANCIAERVACRACQMQNRMDGLHVNCDALDDGSENGSCAAGRPVRCDLTDSTFSVQAALTTIPVPAVGSIDIATGASAGAGSASCAIREVDPFDLTGIGFVCLAPASGCPAGTVDCDGTGTGGTSMAANRTIGSCSSQADCLSQCDEFCTDLGAEAAPTGFGCEGFCNGDTPQECVLDTDCGDVGNGACYGPDGVIGGNICECICVGSFDAANDAGDLSCNLGVTILSSRRQHRVTAPMC